MKLKANIRNIPEKNLHETQYYNLFSYNSNEFSVSPVF